MKEWNAEMNIRLLKTRAGKDFGKRNEEYNLARNSGLSAGVMGLWCKHGMSLAFHILKASEGRIYLNSTIFFLVD